MPIQLQAIADDVAKPKHYSVGCMEMWKSMRVAASAAWAGSIPPLPLFNSLCPPRLQEFTKRNA